MQYETSVLYYKGHEQLSIEDLLDQVICGDY